MEWIFVAILTVSIIHVIEEYIGGFVDQMKQFMPGTDLFQFVSTNISFLSQTARKMAYYLYNLIITDHQFSMYFDLNYHISFRK